MNHTHFLTPSPALPKSSFVWQLAVCVSLSRLVVVIGVDQLSMSHLSHTCKQKYCSQKLIKYTYHKDQTSPVQSSLWSVLDFSKLPWTKDQTAVMVFCGPGISGLFWSWSGLGGLYTPPPIPPGFQVESYHSWQEYQESRRNDQEFFTSQYPLKVTIPGASQSRRNPPGILVSFQSYQDSWSFGRNNSTRNPPGILLFLVKLTRNDQEFCHFW